MKLFCKELKGNEIELDSIEDTHTISEVKKQIEVKLNIPVSQQKLLYLGKILQDSAQVKDYKLHDQAKLMLTRIAKPYLKKILYTHYSRSYDSDTAHAMSNLFIENMKQKIADSSLDDMERLAAVFLRDPAKV